MAAGLCSVCRAIPWVELQPEDVARAATPHHRTRKALEASAQRCPMCRMVLKAALSSFRDTRGVRNGRGYWRQFDAVRLVDTNLTARDISYQKELGACMPVTATEFKGPNPGGRAVIAATGAPNPDGEHVEDKELKLEGLRIDDPPDDMPVCVFGNFWAEREKEVNQPNDVSHLRLVGVGARFAKSASLFDVYGVRPDQVKLCGSSIGLCTDDDTSFASFIPGRLRELHSDSDTAFRRVEKWISDCSSKHAFCGAPKLNPDLPRRVIDVTAYDRGVCLLETAGQRGRYVALSHCWGTSSRLMATRESIDDLKEGIATSFLPKTFQDAIKITRRLGLKYLWIDCLCIVQDDLADWDVEAANMAYIYRNAYVTVAAAASTDSYYGCFPKRAKDSYVSPGTRSLGYATPREASGERRYTMAFTYSTDGAKKPSSVHFLEDEWLPGSSFHTPQRTAIGSFGRRFDPIAGEPLSSRGWTLQERMLSPRIVHYAGDQLYYECETGMWSEDGFVFSDIYFSLQHLLRTQLIAREDHGIPRASGISFIVGRHTATSGRRWEGGWISLVETYSRMRLTVADDKLPAIAGVATVIATETGDSYFAGLWAAHIHEDLCWRVCCYNEYFDRDAKGMQTVPKRGARVGAATRPKDYRAPTWSWASLDAPIKYIPLSYSNLVATVTGIGTTPKRADDLRRVGRLKYGRIDIRAPIYEIKRHTPKKAWDRHGIPVSIDLEDGRGVSVGELHADLPDEDQASLFPCYAVFLDAAHALVVRPNKAELQTYVDPLGKDVSEHLLTTPDVNRNVRENPALKGMGFKALADVVRVGLAVFVKNPPDVNKDGPQDGEDEDEKEPRKWDEERDGKLTLDKILHVSGDGSWGPVTKDDPWVWVTIV